jgi:NAD(P)-dependent dehydrogenase (short-subunit alcohol dehydrogenase family)
VAAEIAAGGGVAAAVRCDLTSDDDVAALVAATGDRLGGPVDTVVNNAGILRVGRFLDAPAEDWAALWEVNVMTTVRVTRAFLPQLLTMPRSRLITISSIAGLKGTAGQAAYNATKHAQLGMMRSLALETGRTGLRVNAVCPGYVLTDLLDLDALATLRGVPREGVWAHIEAVSSIGRTVSVEEVAASVAYLASPAADGVNGQSLVVDGGVVM